MNNTTALALTLLGMGACDALLVAQQPASGPRSYGADAVYLAELPPVIGNNPAVAGTSPERDRRLFAAWGEWRPGRVAARHFVIYDTSIGTTEIFPTPGWLVSADR